MNYTKPEVALLGEAVRVIELRNGKGHTFVGDGQTIVKVLNPAYDLDE
jgi:hypothetical protein